MKRGQVWWAFAFDERCPVVLLSGDEAAEIQAMRIVAPAGTEIQGHAVEVIVGAREGLPHEGVVRVALPRSGRINCHWLINLSQADLVEHAGALLPEKLRELEDALRLAGLE